MAAALAAALVVALAFATSAEPLPSAAGSAAELAAVPETTGSTFGGVVSGRVAVSPLVVGFELEHRITRRTRTTRALATITNAGPIGLDSLAAMVRADSPMVVTRPAGEQAIRRLAPGASLVLSWVICARAAGTYRLTVAVTDDGATLVGPTVVLSLPEATC